MKTLVAPSLALLVASVGAVAMAGDLESGPAVGSGAGTFNVKDITGPRKGRTLCYR